MTSFLAVLASLVAAPTLAVVPAYDRVPAATLLLPYFEAGGPDHWSARVVSLSAEPQLAHVTLWTDLGNPVAGFDLYFPARGAVTLEMDKILVDGVLPTRAPPDLAALACVASDFAGTLPGHTTVGAELRGDAVDGLFVATAGERIRGYLTIDVTRRCTDLYPSDEGYFELGGGGVATNTNALAGTLHIRTADEAFADALVHLEASDGPETSVAGQYTFYGGLFGWSAADQREPLATRWHTPAPPGSDLIVWRDPRRPPLGPTNAAGVSLAALEDPKGAVGFDAIGEPREVSRRLGWSAVTQRVPVAADLASPLDIVELDVTFGVGARGPSEGPTREQAHVMALLVPSRCNSKSVAQSGFAWDTAADTTQVVIAAPEAGP